MVLYFKLTCSATLYSDDGVYVYIYIYIYTYIYIYIYIYCGMVGGLGGGSLVGFSRIF